MTDEMFNDICVGFVSDKGVMLDLDHTTLKSTKSLAEGLCNRYKLEGYIIVRSSPKNYHIIFNRKNISWRKTLQIIFSVVKAVNWGIHQAYHGNMTLRISPKKSHFPEVVYRKGKQDKLVKEYLECYKFFNGEPKMNHKEHMKKCIQDCLGCPLFYTKKEGESCLEILSQSV